MVDVGSNNHPLPLADRLTRCITGAAKAGEVNLSWQVFTHISVSYTHLDVYKRQTQGSGKSLTMVWLAKWIRENVTDSRVLIITDRTELDEQIEKVFSGVEELSLIHI